MKIVQINAVNAVYSTGRSCLELQEYLTERGHVALTAYASGPSRSPRDYRIGTRLDQKCHALLSRLTGKQAYFSRCATKRLLRFMEKEKPDVVLLHNLHANYIHLPLLLSYLAKRDIATVAVLHDCWFFTGKCCHYTVAGCTRWQEQCGNCKSLKRYNKSWFFDRTATMLADKKRLFSSIPRLACVGVSDWLTGEARRAPVFQNAVSITRIYNGIDTARFAPLPTAALREELSLVGKKVILSVATTFSEEKGLGTLLSLAEQLQEDEVLLTVGKLPPLPALPPRLLALPATSSLDRLAALYSMADVFFQPSLEETFGKVSAEALSAGTPVVCFRSTANPELVAEGCGAVVEPGDNEGLLAALRHILARGKTAYTAACRAFATASFEKEANLGEYLALFEMLLPR